MPTYRKYIGNDTFTVTAGQTYGFIGTYAGSLPNTMGISTINSAVAQIATATGGTRTVMQFSDVSGNPQGSGVGSLVMLTAAQNAKHHGAIAVHVKSAVASIWENIQRKIGELKDLTGTVQGEYLYDIDQFIHYCTRHAQSKGWNTTPVLITATVPNHAQGPHRLPSCCVII